MSSKKNNELKSAKFIKLAESRTNKLIKLIRIMSNLSNPMYAYTDEQIEAIFSAIEEELEMTKTKLLARTFKQEKIFVLKDKVAELAKAKADGRNEQ